jgi:hypothetical protein
MRSISADELGKSLSDLVRSLETENESILIRDRGEFGVAVAALLVGDEYERYARWRSEQGWKAVDAIRQAFADVPQEEIERIVDQAVKDVRRERYAARKAS